MATLNLTTIDFSDKSLHQAFARFWSYVDILPDPNACWEWTKFRDAKGYGRYGVARQSVSTHRLSWALANKQPITQMILHSCDNPPCCNPNHLRQGTAMENARDCTIRNRRPTSFSDLPLEIRQTRNILFVIKARAAEQGISHKQIAEKMGIKQPTVTRMLTGKWAVKFDNVISLAWAVGMDVDVEVR